MECALLKRYITSCEIHTYVSIHTYVHTHMDTSICNKITAISYVSMTWNWDAVFEVYTDKKASQDFLLPVLLISQPNVCATDTEILCMWKRTMNPTAFYIISITDHGGTSLNGSLCQKIQCLNIPVDHHSRWRCVKGYMKINSAQKSIFIATIQRIHAHYVWVG